MKLPVAEGSIEAGVHISVASFDTAIFAFIFCGGNHFSFSLIVSIWIL